jgi:hypothetical protein
VSAAAAPRLTGGAIASVMLHAALIAAFIFARPGKIPPGPPIFMIRRDGSVGNIEIINTSHNYSFDQRAKGAVEAAANAKAFGPLPPGFTEDILPVRFRFSPSLIGR